MKRLIFILFALLTTFCLTRAEESFDFSNWLPKGWTSTVKPQGCENPGRGTQFASSATLSFPEVKDVKQVAIIYSCNAEVDGQNSLEVQVGGTSFGIKQLPKKTTDAELVFAIDEAKTGKLDIIITRTKKSVYIKTVTIDGTYDKSLIPEDDPYEGLDNDYSYAEPTTVASHDTLGSKIPFAFIDNNVRVSCIYGTKTQTYFGPMAGQDITFATTKPMKAIVVDGFVRKAFSAEASCGNLMYKSSSAIDLEEEQILAVTDINNTLLTIHCDAQLRCNVVYVYFDANPELDFEEEESEYSYNDETPEVTNMDITFTDLEVEDMTESLGYPCTSLYFSSDEYDLDMWVFATTVDNGTIIPAGTYPIVEQPRNSYTENTVMASPGGYESYDIPTYLITDFEYNESTGSWSYNKVYYLVSGSMEVSQVEGGVSMRIQAQTYFGSTVKALYYNGQGEPPVEEAVDQVSVSSPATKLLRDGQLIIRRDGRQYDILGAPVAE